MRTLVATILCSLFCVDSMSGFQVNPPVASFENGKALYEKYCSTCHGVDGKGEGAAAVYLSPQPRDFTRGIFKFQSTPAGSLPTDQDLQRVLLNGMPGSGMPSWDRLSDQERTNLVAYIKSFSPRFQSEKPGDLIGIGSEPARTPKMVADGKAVYALASCWSCHGKIGKGDGPASGTLMDDQERLIQPYNFTRAGAFKGGGTPKDIYRTFSGGIGGTPMPGYGDDALSLGQQDFADLSNLEGQYTEAEIREVKSFVDQLPPRIRIDAMSPADRKRLADGLRWSLVYYILSLSDPTKMQVTYRTTDHPLTVKFEAALAVFLDPAADQWKNVKESELALISLWERDTPTDRVYVKAATDGNSVAFRLEWEDSTKNDGALHNVTFGDAAAIQFPLDPASDPFFAMGDTSLVVNIWQWKSCWERDLKQYAGVNDAFPRKAVDFYMFDVAGESRAEIFASKDSARALSMSWNAGWGSGNLISAQTRTSPVEDLNARGFRTLTSQTAQEQNVKGKGVWQNGRWSVVFIRVLDPKQKGDVTFSSGMELPVAFAVWDGALGDRNGQKMVTNWYRLTIGSK